ncbi:unnamed protein product, partial [Prorocentrum cordatum]
MSSVKMMAGGWQHSPKEEPRPGSAGQMVGSQVVVQAGKDKEANATYSKLNKDDPLRQHYEAFWPELAAAKPPADQPVAGFKAVEAAARRLDKLQKKVRSAGEQVESAQQYLAESERKLREAMEASIAAEDEFDKLKATVGKQETPAEPAAEKPTLAALLEQFEHEPDDFHKWSEPDKEVWRAAKAKGERMAQTVKEHEEETAKYLRLLEAETARHQEQLRQLEQPLSEVPPHALRQQGQLARPCPPAPQQLPNLEQVQQNMTKQKNAEPEWRPTSRRRERRPRRQGAPRQSSTQKGRATTQQGSRPKASVKKARRPRHIDFFNVTTWGPQAQGYLMEINNTKDRDIIGIAEHHLRQPAQISKDRIAGFDEHYLHEGGSDVAVVISNLHKVRFAVAFVYLECGAGFGERNVDFLCDLREKMAVWGGPWAAPGDFNMTPSELNNSIWPRVLNAQVAAAEDGAPKCFPAAGEARCIDFALISQGLAPYFDQLELLRTVPWEPHIGIRLKLKGRPLMLKGRVLRRPAAIKPPVAVEKMPKSRAACRRAARGGQEAMRRRQQALAEAGYDLDENDMEPVPQLYYDKEVQHVISDELWQATSERVSVRAHDELPQHLQHTVVGKMMERGMLDLGQQYDRFASTLELSLCESIGIPEEERGRHLGHSRPPSYKSASIKDTVTSTPWAGVERKIHAWWAEISTLVRQLSHHDARAQEAAASRLGKTLTIPDEYSGGEQGPSAPEPGPVMSDSQVGRNTMDTRDHDPFEDEEHYLEYRQEIADQEYSDGYHQHTEGQQDSLEFGQSVRRLAAGSATPPPAGRSAMDVQDCGPFEQEEDDPRYRQETADQEDCDGHHQRIEGQQDSIDYGQSARRHPAGPEAEEPRDMGLPPPDRWNEDQHQREWEDYVAMRDDLEYWAAIWMDNLVQLPTDNSNWMQVCAPFLETILGGGGNDGMVRLLRRRYQQVRTHSGHQTQQQINTRWQLAQQLNQPDPGRLNEDGAAKDQQQTLLTDLHAIAEGALVAVKKAHIHWVHDATAGSAKMARAYTKAAERSHLEDILEHEGQVINHPQQLVDLRKEAWQRRWTRDAQKAERIQEALAKLRQAALAQENALEPISKDIIGSIIQHLKRNAGQGADWWRAPELKAMGAQGLEDFVQCLISCEQRAAWPRQFYLVLELLLGKKPGIGGERPIGLMPMPHRIWSAARRPIVATWSKAAAGFWDTAVAGSSALRVALHRLTRAKAATEMGFHAAGVFYDAVNFYDNIGLGQLIEKASDLQYPLLPLAMAVQMYIAPRAIMSHSLFSDMFEPANSMVAGCGQAVDLTRPLLYGILDAARRHHIFVVMQQYLDDLALQVEGARRQAVDQIKYVAVLVHDGFKQLSIPISVKTAVVASDKDLQAEVASILDSLGTPSKQPGAVRDLGVDTSLGKQLRRPTHAARQAKAKRRAAKLKDPAKTDARGAAKVYSAGAHCQQAWDLPARGITPTEAKAVRATEAALLTGGHNAGRCTSTILLIQRGMQEAVTRAIGDQIKQFWLTIVDHPTELNRCQRGWLLLSAKLDALEPNRRWQQVKGPMAGVIAQLLGLGWIPRRLDSWISPAGDEWAYKPYDIPHFGAPLHEVQQSAQQQLWRQAACHRSGEGLQAGGDLFQLQRHLRRRRRKGQHAEAAMLETIAVAGIWTRERHRAANLNKEGDDTCARCGVVIETEEHRYYACPANAEIGHSNDTDLAKKAKDALDQRQDLHFWLRGIPPAAWAAKVDPGEGVAKAAQIFCTSEEAHAAAQAGYKVRADYVFTDGSGGAGETAKDPRLRRCGWAVVAFRFDEQGRPQEVAAWCGTIRAPRTVPRAELTAMSKAIGYTTAATARGLNIVSDCRCALGALKQIQDPEDLDYRSTNYDLWLQTKQQLQNSTDTIMGHHLPSHLIEHPAELERWNGPTWWVIRNEMYAGWGAEHGALDPAIIVQQQTRDHITMAVHNRLLAINMAVTVEDPNKAPQRPKAKRRKPPAARDRAAQLGHDLRKLHPRWWCATCRSGPAKGQIIKDWLAEAGECLGKYGGHQDQHGNVRLDFKAVQIGTQVVDVSHKTQYTHGWLWCEKCGGTSYLGDHKSRIVAGDEPAAGPAAEEGLNEITMPCDFKLGLSNHEAIDLDGGSSKAGDPQPAPQQPPSHPHSVVQASWGLVDHMEGYAELWMNMVDQGVWGDMGDWMEHCVPCLLAITNVGGRIDSQEQTRAVTVQELQQIKDFCEEVWRNTHRKRRRLMTRMLTLPHGTRQQVTRVHMDAFQNRRNNILAHSIPSSERRPLPGTAEASREWSPENLDDDDSTPDSEAPEQEGEPSDQEMETTAGPDQRSDTNSLMQPVVQVALKLTKPVGPDLMKFASEADEAGLLHPRLRHKREADQDPEQKVAWLERNRLEQHMQSLAGCWIQKEGEQGWPSWQAACVPHVLRELQTGVYQRLFSHVSGLSRQRSQRRAAEEICRMAWLNSGEARRQSQQQDPKEAERRKAIAEQFPGVTEPVMRSRSPRPQAAVRVPSRAPARQPMRHPEARATSSPAELRTATPAPELERPK